MSSRSNHLFLLVASVLLLLSSCSVPQIVYDKSDTLASINIIDQEGISETFSNPDRLKNYQNVNFLAPQPYKKVLRIYQRNPEGNIIACVTSYHPNGQIKQYLDVVNGRAHGAYREWHENGVLKIDAEVIGGDADITPNAEKTWLFQGCAKAWDDDGNLIANIPYEKGHLVGNSLYYHSNGNLWKKVPFEKNQVHGTYEVYLENGTLLTTSEYVYGTREGKSLRFWEEGKIASEETFLRGRLITGCYYEPNGELTSEIRDGHGFKAVFGRNSIAELQEYAYGIMEGEVRVFGNNKQLVKVYHLKNGFKHGEEIDYFDHPGAIHPKLLVTWHDAKIQGWVKTWYANGTMESQKEMTDNKKSGLSTAWYQDGNLMMIEEYDQNKLVRGEYYKKGDKIPLSQVSKGKGLVTLFDAQGSFLRKITYLNGKPDE